SIVFERTRQGAVDIVRGNEPLNWEHIDVMRSVLERCSASGQPRVVLDMHAVPLVDSAGLELLVQSQEKYQKRGGILKLAGVNALCHEILKISGVGRLFEIFPTSGAAVGSFVR